MVVQIMVLRVYSVLYITSSLRRRLLCFLEWFFLAGELMGGSDFLWRS
jgi:hypothetical protein